MSEKVEAVPVNDKSHWPASATAFTRNEMAIWARARQERDEVTVAAVGVSLLRQGWRVCETTSTWLRKLLQDETIYAWMQGDAVNDCSKGWRLTLKAPVLVMSAARPPFTIQSDEPVRFEVVM
jgi:hypothetical protein